MTSDVLLSVRGLKMHFHDRTGFLGRSAGSVRAVDGVDLDVRRGETLGLVGESGCGKSTLGRCIVRLYEPTAGQLLWHDTDEAVDLATLTRKAMRPLRRRIQIIFQDPFASLNPRMTVGEIIGEPLRVHRVGDSNGRFARVQELMDLCGLNPDFARRYPHEFSGGQRQRIGIARALAAEPALIVCDEPISALDVSIQAQIINLLMRLQRELGLTYLFIAHDLAAVRHISTRVAVMYLGRVVEVADAADLYGAPSHPYTRALIGAIPIPDPAVERARQTLTLHGEPPSPRNPPPGCAFHARCPLAFERCRVEAPALQSIASGHFAACHAIEDAGTASP